MLERKINPKKTLFFLSKAEQLKCVRLKNEDFFVQINKTNIFFKVNNIFNFDLKITTNQKKF